MVIMDAERLGVSELRQPRGRGGRGSAPGLCLLVTEAQPDTPSRQRLAAAAATLDGFKLSRPDLEPRREGDAPAAAQAGPPPSPRLARPPADEGLIAPARGEATPPVSTH